MIELRVYDPTNSSYIGSLTHAYNRSFIKEFNGVGVGRFNIDMEDSQVGLIQPRRVIRWRLDGTDVFASYVDDIPSVVYDQGERPSYSIEGPGLAGWLGTGKGGAIVRPWHNQLDTRVSSRFWGWAASGIPYPDDWHWPYTRGEYRNPLWTLPRLRGSIPDWPDRRAEWLWHEPLTEDTTNEQFYDPAGFMLLRRNLPNAYQGPANIYIAGTNDWVLYFDGEEIGSGGGYQNMRTFQIEFDDPDRNSFPIAAEVSKRRRSGWRYDPGLVIITVRASNSEGNDTGQQLFRSFGGPSSPWRCIGNPSEIPGVTPGRILNVFLREAQDRGALQGLTYDFTNANDSNGDPWEVDTINESYEVGTKLFDVLRSLAELHGISWEITPTGVLRVFNVTGTNWSGDLGPYVSGSASGRGIRANSLLTGTQRGYSHRQDTNSVGLHGLIEDYVDLGNLHSRGAAHPLLDRLLLETARTRDDYDYVLSNDSPKPFEAFDVGDAYEDGRIMQITMVQDEDGGDIEWAVTVRPGGA